MTQQEREQLIALQGTINEQSKRLDDIADIARDAAEKASDAHSGVVEVRAELKAMRDSLNRLIDKLDTGNGVSTKIARLEGAAVNIAADVKKCQAGCGARWKILITAVLTLITGLLIAYFTKK